MTFYLPFLHVQDFSIVLLPGAEAVESQKAPLKPSFVEQMKNASWPESKYYCYYGIQ
jgi:hypothetical protein